jgi:uncharacterized protein with beta-barrel porin domain
MQLRVETRIGRSRLGGLLASTSLAALLIGGSAPRALACYGGPYPYTNNGTTSCIVVRSATTGNIVNNGTVSNTAVGAGIGVTYASHFGSNVPGGGVVNTGTVSATNLAIMVDAVSNFSGGISNSGTITVTNPNFTAVIGIFATSANNPVSTFSGGISNSGVISGGAQGIYGLNVNNWTGGITNAGTGTIAAGQTAIWLDGGVTMSGNISNAGTISAPVGIRLDGTALSGAIIDSGNILASGRAIQVNGGSVSASQTAIKVTGATLTGGIVNSGSLTATAGDGIYVGGFTTLGHANVTSFSGGIVNTGAISAGRSGIYVINVASFSDGISNGSGGTISAATYGIYVAAVSTFGGGISNSGTISASAHTGIFVDAVANFAGGIANSGTISAGSNGILVTTVSTFAGGIVNGAGGTIASANGDGIDVTTISSFADGISNAGTISAHDDGIIVANSANFSGGIANTGTISGAEYGLIVNSIATFAGGISNGGTISAATWGIYVAGVSTFGGGISNSGTITAKTGIRIDNGVTFAGGAAIVNSGTISGTTAIDVSRATSPVVIDQNAGAINGAIKLSNSADVLNINGGTIAGNIVGQGSSDTLNFQLGAGTTYVDSNSFTGINQVNINSGTVVLNGANSVTHVDVYGTLSGTGSIDPTTVTIHSGGTFAPGNGTPGTSMAITGNLGFQSGALYQIYLNPTTSTYASVTGIAAPAGAVNAFFASGSYISKQYTILTAGSISGTFASLVNSNLPSNFHDSLSYDATDVYLDLTLNFETPPATSLNGNQNNVANALIDYFNTTGGIPTKFATLPASALTALDGEAATGASKGAFQLMSDFLELMLDPTAGGGGGVSGGGAAGFAPEQDTSLPADTALAYAKALRQSPSQPSPASGTGLGSFDQRWTAWGSAFGGASHIDGDTAAGTNNVNASDHGFAAGMDYHVTPNTVYGFGLAGGGTNWNLAQALGSGRSDSFQTGVYAKSHAGPLYLSGALAFANHWFTTDRTALGDQLQAKFSGQSYAARSEVGYRYGLPITGTIVGVTPYAALQAQDFHTPSYSESDLTGGGFTLSYASMNATDTRSELGARFDNLQIVDAMPLVLRGRLAWAHDWYTNATALNAAFQTLPGSNFIVNGAAPPKNSALTTAAAELHITANWTAIAKFDGEFGDSTQIYGGTGTLRYSW